MNVLIRLRYEHKISWYDKDPWNGLQKMSYYSFRVILIWMGYWALCTHQLMNAGDGRDTIKPVV